METGHYEKKSTLFIPFNFNADEFLQPQVLYLI